MDTDSPESIHVDREAFITEVSKHIGKDWRRLARHLEFSNTDIEAIEYADPADLKEHIYQFFRKWKQQLGQNATVQRLSEGLKAAGLQELDSRYQVKQTLQNADLPSDTSSTIRNADPSSDTCSTIRNADPPSDTSSTIRNTADPPSDTSSTIRNTADPPSDTSSTIRNADPPSDTSSTIRNTADPPSDTSSTIRNADPPSDTSSTIRNTDPPSDTSSTIRNTADPPSDTSSTIRNVDPLSDTGSTIVQDPQRDILNELGGELFNNPLYDIFQEWCKCRPGFRTVIVYILLMYQFGIVALVTLCEDDGLLHPPLSERSVLSDLMVRMLKLALRTILHVITPLVFILHLDTLAKKPEIPKFMSLTREEALYRIHVKLGMTEEVVKSHITLRWLSTVLNNILFAAFIYYLGVFITTNYYEKPLTARDSICNRLHILLFNSWIEGTQTVIFVLVIGIMKEFYCYENKIAVCAVVIGEEGQILFDEIRRRWYLIDQYCYWMPVGLLLIAVISYSTGKGLIPEPRQEIEPSEIITWYFWNFVLSGLTLLGSSPNRLVKHAASISFILLTIAVCTLERNGIRIPGTGTNSAMIFLYATIAVFNINLISTLYRCHKYHHDKAPDTLNLFPKYFCLISMFLLPVLIIFMTSREVIFFVPFVKQQL